MPPGDPPRPQAGQHHGGGFRRSAGDGLGPGQGDWASPTATSRPAARKRVRASRTSAPIRAAGPGLASQQRLGDPGVHAAGAGPRRGGPPGHAVRRVRPGGHPVRDPDRPAALRGPGCRSPAPPGDHGRPGRRLRPPGRLRGGARIDSAGPALPGCPTRRPACATPGRWPRRSRLIWPGCKNA